MPVVYVSQPSSFWPMSDWSLWFFPPISLLKKDSKSKFSRQNLSVENNYLVGIQCFRSSYIMKKYNRRRPLFHAHKGKKTKLIPPFLTSYIYNIFLAVKDILSFLVNCLCLVLKKDILYQYLMFYLEKTRVLVQ